MAQLQRRHTFKRWAPDIGENREVLERWLAGGEEGECPGLFLELATGLTAEQLSHAFSAIGETRGGLEETRKAFVEALGDYVRVHAGPHTVDGMEVGTLAQYLELVQTAADFGMQAVKELLAALRSFNSFTGPDQLFSLRRSGGQAGTGSPSVVKGSAPTAGPSSGSTTSASVASASTAQRAKGGRGGSTSKKR